jgi:1-deoxy-D-xylulose-5-phosphate synthase
MYSTFLQRSYDQVIHDVCLQNLPVVFCLDRAGLVGSDGKTHQGVFDLSYLTHIPNLTVLAPTTPCEFKDMLDYAYSLNSPVAIRYPKGSCGEREYLPLKDGVWETIKTGEKATLLAVGPRMLKLALDFSEKHAGIGVVNARSVKPLCEKTLDKIKNTTVVTLEENSAIGGFGSLVRKYYSDKNESVKTICLGVEDRFIAHGSVESQLKENGLTIENLEQVLGLN